MPDWLHLERYIATADQAAFRAIVDAHLPMIYNLARREFAGNTRHAEDIAQSVFLLLAQKAHSIPRHKNLAAWLYQTTHYCCSNLKRIEARRLRHEREAAMPIDPAFIPIDQETDRANLLSAGLAKLSLAERDALLIRYMSGPQVAPLAQVASALDISPDAAEKRIARALAKLRDFFSRNPAAKDLAHSSALLAFLAAQSAITPQSLSAFITSAATSAAPASPTALAIVSAFAKSSAVFTPKAAAILLLVTAAITTLTTLAVVHSLSVPTASAAPTPTPLPDADALPLINTGPLPTATYFADRSKNVFPDGIFNIQNNELPHGWTAAPNPFALSIASFHPKFHLINLTSDQLGKKIELRSSIPVNPEWKTLAVRAVVGFDNLTFADTEKATAGALFYFLDKNNNDLGAGVLLGPALNIKHFLKTRMATLRVPADAATLAIAIRLSDAKGTLSIGDLAVCPVDEKSAPNPAQVMLLHKAILAGNIDQVAALITADQRLLESRNLQWDCATPLVGAAWNGKTDVVRKLIELGADLKGRDDNGPGWTAATTAAWWGRADCLQILLTAAPEDPQEVIKILNAGRASHHNGGTDAEYQQCHDFLAKLITTTQPNAIIPDTAHTKEPAP